MKESQENERNGDEDGHRAVQSGTERTEDVAAVELGGGEKVKGGGEKANPGGAADGMNQERAS